MANLARISEGRERVKERIRLRSEAEETLADSRVYFKPVSSVSQVSDDLYEPDFVGYTDPIEARRVWKEYELFLGKETDLIDEALEAIPYFRDHTLLDIYLDRLTDIRKSRVDLEAKPILDRSSDEGDLTTVFDEFGRSNSRTVPHDFIGVPAYVKGTPIDKI